MLYKGDASLPTSPNLGPMSSGQIGVPALGGRVNNTMLRRVGSILAGAGEDFPPGGLVGQPYCVDGKGSHRTGFYIGIIDYLQRCVYVCMLICVCIYIHI